MIAIRGGQSGESLVMVRKMFMNGYAQQRMIMPKLYRPARHIWMRLKVLKGMKLLPHLTRQVLLMALE